ncbi:hypothetical protein [Pseudomonas sp. TR47]|uniref:hypothetical protein n=1 Tax=Pseudomonas sp. TR47 TaxID=3342639 RepID=UPI00377067FA
MLNLLVSTKMVMANSSNSVSLAKQLFSLYEDGQSVPVHELKSLISSPRLFDVYLKDFLGGEAILAGDSFLDLHTNLADSPQKTYAIKMSDWEVVRELYVEVDSFHFRDTSVSKVQVWPYDPRSLSPEQMRLAVAVSYTDSELLEEPRLCGALRNLLSEYRVEFFWERRVYDS